MRDQLKKLYVMRLQDHLRMLKRRQRATNAAVTRYGLTPERVATEFKLMEEVQFMQMWIREVKK